MLGIAPAQASEHQAFLENWLSEGKHGEMDYLTQHLQKRLDPTALVPNAKAIICVVDRYPTRPTSPPEESAEVSLRQAADQQQQSQAMAGDVNGDAPEHAPVNAADIAQGKIARYAWKKDYHRDMKKRMHRLTDALRAQFPGNTFKATVDTAPVLEREHAQRAGLGWVGKHTLLIHPQMGSFFLLGEIITTLPLQTSMEAGAKVMTNHCGACTRCIDACPTQCISPYSVDATRCISYLTLEHRSAINPALHEKMGDWVAGCDVCQEVCPFNQDPTPEAPQMEWPRQEEQRTAQPAEQSAEPRLLESDGTGDGPGGEEGADAPLPMPTFMPRTSFGLLEIMNWTPQARQDALIGSALKRIKLEQFKRNAIIAAGNVIRREPGHPQATVLREKINALANDPATDELVRTTAMQVIARKT